MRFLQILLVGGTALAASNAAQAGSSFSFVGQVENAPSMVKLGDSASEADGSNSVFQENAIAGSPEMPANKLPSELVSSDPGKAMVAATPPAEKIAAASDAGQNTEIRSQAKTAASGIDPTTTASAPETQKPLETLPFSASELRQ